MLNLEKIRKEKPILELLNFSILNIDKPREWTSFDVVNYIRKMFSEFNVKKSGHLGTLDPNVTGVLPVVVGNSCKIQGYFMRRDKVYIGKMKIHKKISREELEKAMKKFLGKINQLPPRKSRVKRVIREREVRKFELVDFDEKNLVASFVSEVEAGTYIRKLCSDLGDSLGIGIQMIELRRTKAGLFSDQDKEFCKIPEIEEAVKEFKENKNAEKLRKLLVPAEIITELIPSIEVKPEFIEKLNHGSPFFDEMPLDLEKARKIIEKGEVFAVVSSNKLIEIAKYSDKFEQKNILAKAECVINPA